MGYQEDLKAAYDQQQQIGRQQDLTQRQQANSLDQRVQQWAAGGYQGENPRNSRIATDSTGAIIPQAPGPAPSGPLPGVQQGPPQGAATPAPTPPPLPGGPSGGDAFASVTNKKEDPGWASVGPQALNPNLGKDLMQRGSMSALASMGRNPY